MPIYEDIISIGQSSFQVDPKFGPDFFTQSITLPEEGVEIQKEEKTVSQFSDWKQEINRMFMKGLTAKEILNSLGERIEESGQKNEILNYISKYEGLIGTVFVDSGVLESGFPQTLIPKEWKQYHRFAINCRNPIMKRVVTKAEGGMSGDIEAFLSATDKTVDEKIEVCSLTGLPVLRAGMFTSEKIKEILSSIGQTGNSLADLQKVMKILALHITEEPKQRMEFEKPDLQFALGEQKVTVEPQEEFNSEQNVLKYNLKPSAISANIQKERSMSIQNYSPSKKADIQTFINIQFMEKPEEIDIKDTDLNLSTQAVNTMEDPVEMEYVPSQKQDISFSSPMCDIFHDTQGPNLTENGLIAEAAQEEEKMEGPVFLTYEKSKKNDIDFVEIPTTLKQVKMDEDLRF